MTYTDAREMVVEDPDKAPDFDEFYNGPFDPNSLTTLGDLDARLEELKNGNL